MADGSLNTSICQAMALKFARPAFVRLSTCRAFFKQDIGWELVPMWMTAFQISSLQHSAQQLLVLLKALIEVSCTCVEDIVEHMSNLDGVTVLF